MLAVCPGCASLQSGHICLGHNSLILDFFFFASAGVTCDFYLWHCGLCPVISVQIWKQALLDNSPLICFSLPKAIPNPPLCLFLNISPSARACFLLFSFFSCRHLTSPHSSIFPDCNRAWAESKFGGILSEPSPRVELILDHEGLWNLEQQ